MYIYKSTKLNTLLSSIYSIQDVYKKQRTKQCPYDGITFCSVAMPKRTFLALAKRFKRPRINSTSYYKNGLYSNIINVSWEPIFGGNKWTTRVRINPNVQELTPQGVLDLLAFVFEDLTQVHVASFDEKIDLENVTIDEVVKRLKVPYVRSIDDFECKGETYYFGKRRGQQTKVYNKAKQFGLKNKVITRIEKTKKFKSNQPTLFEFLSYTTSQALTTLKLIDTDGIDKRTVIGKHISKYDTLKEAELNMPTIIKERYKNHSKKYATILDFESEFADQLKQWKKTSFKNHRELKRKIAHL